MVAAWPTLEALKEAIDVTSTDFDSGQHLEGVRQAAIAQVKTDVGDWDEAVDDPDYSLARAAMYLAIRIARAPSQGVGDANVVVNDPEYWRLLKGRRRRFSIG